MRLCRVIGNVVASVSHPAYRGRKLMVVQPVEAGGAGADLGSSFLAVDNAQAGPGDLVLVMSEGNGIRQILQMGAAVPIRSLIVGVVDRVDVEPSADGGVALAEPAKPRA